MPSIPAPRRHLLTASALWLLLLGAILYLSLYPLSDWTLRRPSAWHWIWQGIPRFYSYGDLIVNLIAYGGFGFLSVRLCQQRFGLGISLVLAFIAGTALSFGMETAQSFLPRRVPSLLDLAANSCGTFLGALAAACLPPYPVLGLLTQGHSHSLRFPRYRAMAGLLLILWLIGQIPAQQLLWISAPVSPWPGESGLPEFWQAALLPDAWQPMTEILLICLSILLPALLVSELIRPPNARLLAVYALLALAVVLRIIASPHVYLPQGQWETYTRGMMIGLGLSAVVLVFLIRWRAGRRRILALCLIPFTMLLASTLPPDPALEALLEQPPSSPILKAATPALRSLLRLINSFWLLAVAYYFLLEAAGTHRRRRRSQRIVPRAGQAQTVPMAGPLPHPPIPPDETAP